MKIGNKKLTWNKKIVTYAFLALVLFVVLGTSYAYFTARVTGNPQKLQANTGTMKLALSGTTDVLCDNMFPGGDCEVQFTVTSTGTLETEYDVDIINVENTFVNDELVYTITRDNTQVKGQTVAPNELVRL